MADLTKTVSNQLGIVGIGEPMYWGTLVWGTNEWGSESVYLLIAHAFNSDLTTTSTQILTATFDRVITNNLSMSSGQILTAVFDRVITNGCDITTAIGNTFTKVIDNSITPTSVIASIYLMNGIYYLVFPGGVTNAILSTTPTYTASAAVSTIWTEVAKPTTVWS